MRADVGYGSRAAVARCGNRVSLAPESRPTASSIDHLFSATSRNSQALQIPWQSTPRGPRPVRPRWLVIPLSRHGVRRPWAEPDPDQRSQYGTEVHGLSAASEPYCGGAEGDGRWLLKAIED